MLDSITDTSPGSGISNNPLQADSSETACNVNGIFKRGLSRNFWAAWVICMFLTLGLAALLNYVVDPFSIFGSGIFEPYRENSYVTKAEMFEQLPVKPEVLIIGSSRVGSLDPEVVTQITGKSCFNWSVPSAGVEIINAIVRMAVEKYGTPIDTIIVAVDPEAFHPNMTIHAQARLATMYSEYIGEVGQNVRLREFVNKVLRLVTIEQTSASIKVLRRETLDNPTDTPALYRDDGFAFYTPNEEAIAAGTFNLESTIDKRLTSYPDDFLTITRDVVPSGMRMDEWVGFLDYCTEHGIMVYAYLPPAHPRFIELLTELGSMPVLEEISSFLKETVEAHGGIFRDFTYLDSFGGDENQFYDEVHMRKGNNDRILHSLLENEGRTDGSGAD